MNNLIEKVSKRYAEYTAMFAGTPENASDDDNFMFYAPADFMFKFFCKDSLNNQLIGIGGSEELYKKLTYKNIISLQTQQFVDEYSDFSSAEISKAYNARHKADKETLLKEYKENCREEAECKPFSKTEADLLDKFEDYLISAWDQHIINLLELLVTFKNVNVEKVAEALANCWEQISSEYNEYIQYIPTQAKERLFTKLKEKGENINI